MYSNFAQVKQDRKLLCRLTPEQEYMQTWKYSLGEEEDLANNLHCNPKYFLGSKFHFSLWLLTFE